MIRSILASVSALALAACGETGSGAPATSEAVEIAVPDIAGPAAWEVDRNESFVGFVATQNDKAFEGSFARWNAAIALDPEAPEEAGQIEAVIDLSSVDAGSKDRNEALPQEGWFHTALHPTATYRSTAITRLEGDSYEARGTLTIKGVAQDVDMPFTLTIDNEGRAVADGSVILDRSDFGIGKGEFATDKWVGFEVEVRLHMEATPAGSEV